MSDDRKVDDRPEHGVGQQTGGQARDLAASQTQQQVAEIARVPRIDIGSILGDQAGRGINAQAPGHPTGHPPESHGQSRQQKQPAHNGRQARIWLAKPEDHQKERNSQVTAQRKHAATQFTHTHDARLTEPEPGL
ncbi:hypothetical protein ABS71_07330 [bacterium SCN 62-11]|nr:MAG: hypothetical protein ABS71_07330 [bacterium SCN 62-11]